MNQKEIFKKHQATIYCCAFSSASFAVTSTLFPGTDIPFTITSWSVMLTTIASNANRQLDQDTALKIVTSIATGGTTYIVGCKAFTFSLNIIPGIGTLGAATINVLLSALFTIRLGKLIAIQMEDPNFRINDLMSLGKNIASIVFAIPTFDELKHTFDAYQNYEDNT